MTTGPIRVKIKELRRKVWIAGLLITTSEHISDDDLSTMIKETEEVVKYFERRHPLPRLNASLVIKTLRMELESLRGMVSNRAFSKSSAYL